MSPGEIRKLRQMLADVGDLLPLRQGDFERYHVFTYRDASFCPAAGRVLLRMNEHFEHEKEAALIVAAINALPAMLDCIEKLGRSQ